MRHSLRKVWSLCLLGLGLAVSVLKPQAWHSDKLGRSLVIFFGTGTVSFGFGDIEEEEEEEVEGEEEEERGFFSFLGKSDSFLSLILGG